MTMFLRWLFLVNKAKISEKGPGVCLQVQFKATKLIKVHTKIQPIQSNFLFQNPHLFAFFSLTSLFNIILLAFFIIRLLVHCTCMFCISFLTLGMYM